MKFYQWIFSIVVCLSANFSVRAEPASGYIVTSEYGTKEGVAVGQKRGKRIWFQGANVRIEKLIGDDITDVSVGGENSWSASPAAQRLLFEISRALPQIRRWAAADLSRHRAPQFCARFW